MDIVIIIALAIGVAVHIWAAWAVFPVRAAGRAYRAAGRRQQRRAEVQAAMETMARRDEAYRDLARRTATEWPRSVYWTPPQEDYPPPLQRPTGDTE